ncbi:MAG: D-hexose-6-phosphate mutarotase [Herminiimonas sp.]|nr:D-hexose-6-phosphate mutarotase [Herminiimonas sp.]
MIKDILWRGIEATELHSADGATAVLARHGAHLLSWIPAGGPEVLFVSDRTRCADGDAIRGGVPVIFPQFAERGPARRHGFARNVRWRLLSAEVTEGATIVRHGLDHNAAGDPQWPYRFALELTVRLDSAGLALTLDVHNPSTEPWQFTAALHTYLRIEPRAIARVRGLRGSNYIDQVRDGAQAVQPEASLLIENEIDRIYTCAPHRVDIDDGKRVIDVRQQGFPDTVVWNPGPEKGNAIVDLTSDDYRAFVCVEAAAAALPVVMAAGAHWRGTQSLQVRHVLS